MRDKPAVGDADGMQAGRGPLALWVAAGLVALTALAVSISLVVVDRGSGFSLAGTDAAGRVALVGPVVLCVVAAVGLGWRHPDRPLAAALAAAAALAWLLSEWDNPQAGSAWVFSLGLALFAVAPTVVLHVALADARGRLPGRTVLLLVAMGYAVTIGIQGMLSAIGFDPEASGCLTCPVNLWNIGGGDWASTVDALGVRAGLAWSVLATVAVLVTWLRASAALRRARALRWLSAGVFLGLTVAAYARSLDRGFLGADLVDRRVWLAQAAALAGMAAGLLAELVRERRAERALAGVVVDLSGPASPTGSLRDALAARLSDPGLILAFPVDGMGLIDGSARRIPLPPAGDRVVTPLSYGGVTLATLVHRRGVLGSKDAIDDLVATIHLGLEHERLQAQALAQVEALRASGIRLVQTGDEERRRLERDLHDGAQQRLVGLALGLRLLGARTGTSDRLAEAEVELQAAIDGLRALARGLAPLVLTDAGLAAAVRALAESRALRVTALPSGRYLPVVESTAYVAIDRASAASPATVSLIDSESTLTVRVSVTGAAPDLGDLADRATTLGGTATITSSGGTHDIVLSLPVTAPDAGASWDSPRASHDT